MYYVSKNRIFKLCIPWKLKKDIFHLTHDSNHHCEYHRAYVKTVEFVYIRHLSKRLRKYIKHCKKCLKKQTTKHALYELLNSIKSMILFFHIVSIDFIVALPKFKNGMNSIFITTDKFSKRINFVLDKITWFAPKWIFSWLIFLQKKNWDLFKAIFFDRNPKFVTSFWKSIFRHLKISLLYITAYHPSADEQSERTNQTVEITLKYSLMKNENMDFVQFFQSIQSTLNNSVNAATGISPNEIIYEFKILEASDLLNNELTKIKASNENSATSVKKSRDMFRKKAKKFIVFAQYMEKIRYDEHHKQLNFKKEFRIYFRLHKGYSQSDITNRKFSKQRIGPIKMLKKVEKLTYELDISHIWKIHSVMSIIHIESASEKKDSYERISNELGPVKITKKNEFDSYEVEKIIIKKTMYTERDHHRRRHREFRIKWLNWNDQHNRWMKKENLNACVELIKKFEERVEINF